jgi:outer membrane protein assembly factor BamB
VLNGVVYVGCGDDYLYALNEQDGSTIWKYLAAGAVISAPRALNGVIYVGSDAGVIYTLGANDGALKWQFSTGGIVHASAAFSD